MVSVIAKPGLAYPSEPPFSPDEAYPEYEQGDLSSKPNPVYRAVRDSLRHAGLDAARFGTGAWNPLGEYIRPGQRVFVLCNFVYHCRPNENRERFFAKVTHGSVLRPVLDYALKAAGPTGSVSFGNAPLQFADWDRLMQETGAGRVRDFFQARGIAVEAKDLRLFTAKRDRWGGVIEPMHRDEEGAREVKLGKESMLAEIDRPGGAPFRVSDYDPARIEAFHRAGRHVYVLNRAVLESDVIIHVPKLKTHEKVGITCAIKGCVGAVAHKDCLAHHRFGDVKHGGDEYPGAWGGVKLLMSWFHDVTQRMPAVPPWGYIARLADRWFRTGVRRLNGITAGAWWGNDTCWRMAVDLFRILKHAKSEGAMTLTEVRKHVVVMDGVIAGDGEGPLNPRAVPLGLVLVSDDPPLSDVACARIMGFNPSLIPLTAWSMRSGKEGELSCFWNGEKIQPGDLFTKSGRGFLPPPGWTGHLGIPPRRFS